MSSKRGYDLPEVIDPDNRLCVTVLVPDDVRHIAAFFGALTALGQHWNWDDDGTGRKFDVARVWDEIAQQSQAKFAIGDCDSVAEYRVQNCYLEVRYSGDANWTQLAYVCGQDGEDGAPGAPGEKGDKGDPGDCNCAPELPIEPDGTGNVRRCNAVWELTTWLFETYNDVIDQAEAADDKVDFLLKILGLFTSWTYFSPLMLEVYQAIIDATFSAARAWDTVEQRSDFAENLYCWVDAHGFITEEKWIAFVEYYKSVIGVDGAAFGLTLNAVTYEGISYYLAAGSYGNDEVCLGWSCEGEYDWCVEFDFSTDAYSSIWHIQDNPQTVQGVPGVFNTDHYETAHWDNGTRWYDHLSLLCSNIEYNITRIDIWQDYSEGTWEGSAVYPALIMYLAGAEVYRDNAMPRTTFATILCDEYIDTVHFYGAASGHELESSLNGSWRIDKVRIYGKNPNPFAGIPECEET